MALWLALAAPCAWTPAGAMRARHLSLPRAARAGPRLTALAPGAVVELQTLEIASEAQASPLIILHGLFGSARNFLGFSSMLSKALDRKRDIIMVDLRNHGRSPHAATMTYEDMARDVVALLDARGIRRAAVIGHSMGGKVASVLALKRPDLVESLAVLDIAPVNYCSKRSPTWREVVSVVDACAAIDMARVKSRDDAAALLEPHVPNPLMRAFVLTNLDVRPYGEAEWRINVAGIRDQLDHIAGFPYEPDGSLQYPGQAYFIAGGASDFIKAMHLPAIQGFFPQFTIAKIRDAGHWIHTESPDDTLRQVKSFLDQQVF